MAKGHSGLFEGTKGDRTFRGISPSYLKDKAFEYAEKVSTSGTREEKDNLNTVTIAYDEENDKYYYGMNKGIKLHNSPKNDILFGKDGIIPKTSLNDFPIGNCSEVDAVNNALNAGAKLENLHLTTLDVKRKNIRSHNIIGKCSCENCTSAFKGKVKKNNTGWKD